MQLVRLWFKWQRPSQSNQNQNLKKSNLSSQISMKQKFAVIRK